MVKAKATGAQCSQIRSNSLKNALGVLGVLGLDVVIRFICAIGRALSDDELRTRARLVVRLDGLGDYMLSRSLLPYVFDDETDGCKVLCGSPGLGDLIDELDRSVVDAFIPVDSSILRKSFWSRLRFFFVLSRRYNFAQVTYFSLSREFFVGDAFARILPARKKVSSRGEYSNSTPFSQAVANRFYSRLVEIRNVAAFEFERNREFVQEISGKSLNNVSPMIKGLPPAEGEGGIDLEGRFAVVACGAGKGYRQWEPSAFAAVARELLTWVDWVIICGGKGEYAVGEEIREGSSDDRVLNRVGSTSLAQMVRYIAACEIIVGNESGPMHIAACLSTAGVCVSNGNHLGRFHPYPERYGCSVRYVYPFQWKNEREYQHWKSRLFNGSDMDIRDVPVWKLVEAVRTVREEKMGSLNQPVARESSRPLMSERSRACKEE